MTLQGALWRVQASLEKASIDEVFVDVTTLVEKELLVRPA